MALSYALKLIEQRGEAKLTNYGEFLAKFPPEYEAQIYENTSWSCFHGVERWRSDCGCNGGKAGWNQKWRAPLREALDWLRDNVAGLTETVGHEIFRDVWAARDAYVDVVLARGNVASGHAPTEMADAGPFLDAQAAHPLSPTERIVALKLMEMQRHAMLMYTSCGWFFDDISGIETVQIIAYSGRVLQLAGEVFGVNAEGLELGFIDRLRAAKSNDAAAGDGGQLFLRSVKTEQVGLEEVAAHYAISSVFTSYAEETRLFGYVVRRLEAETLRTGRGRVVIGRALVSSTITGEAETLTYAVLHFGDQNITAAVKRAPAALNSAAGAAEREGHAALIAAVRESVNRSDIPAVVRIFDRYFGETAYSITSLFNDEERRILKLILQPTLDEIESTFSTIYERHASLLHFLSQAGLPQPAELTLAAGFSVNAGLHHAIEADPVDDERIRLLLKRATDIQVALDTSALGYIASQRMKRAMVALYDRPTDFSLLDRAVLLAGALRELPFDFRLWQAQNIWYSILERSNRQQATGKPEQAAAWLSRFHTLGRFLRIAVDELVIEDDGLANGIS
jgi:hypothetical protein